MLEALRQPRSMAAAIAVAILAATFVRLGFWQLERLDERQELNAVGEQRISNEPVDLAIALDEVTDVDSLEYRRVTAEGRYDPEQEILIRSQVELGQAGFHVITPLVLSDGSAVLVNRGWVPLVMDTPPVDAAPGSGTQTVQGWVHLTEQRPSLGQEEPEGDLDVFNRVDIDRISEQVPYELAPVYLVLMGERRDELPIPVNPPDFTNDGPHLSYAVQWFGFATVGVVGFFFLLRRKGGQST